MSFESAGTFLDDPAEPEAVSWGIAQGLAPDPDVDLYDIPIRLRADPAIWESLHTEVHYFQFGQSIGIAIARLIESGRARDLAPALLALVRLWWSA